MYFYCHYINKGFKPEYLYELPIYTKTLFMAAMDMEIERKNKYLETQNELVSNSEGVMPVLPIQF